MSRSGISPRSQPAPPRSSHMAQSQRLTPWSVRASPALRGAYGVYVLAMAACVAEKPSG